jgi:hypothetical protein
MPLHLSGSGSGWIEVDFGEDEEESLWYVPPNEDITFLSFKDTWWELEGLLLFVWEA